MLRKLPPLIAIFLCACSQPPAHGEHRFKSFSHQEISRNEVAITEDDNYIYIHSNAIPDHRPGKFPNPGNPNPIRAQEQSFRVPKAAHINPYPQEARVFGIALNGVLFEPGTAECWGRPRRGPRNRSRAERRFRPQTPRRPNRTGTPPPRPSDCEWREEAIVNGAGQLGLDQHNAHVQPNGKYHYHGVPTGYIDTHSKEMIHVGYAADGLKIFYDRSNTYRSSYVLRTGVRASGPGGNFDGRYTADYVYRPGAGNLKECNNTLYNEEPIYLITHQFPFIPRCWLGEPDDSFLRFKNF